jgi:hypothetical protein
MHPRRKWRTTPSSTDPKDLGFPPEATLREIEIRPANKPGTTKDSTSSGALTTWSREAATTSSRAAALESVQRRRPAECRRRGAAPHTAEPRALPSRREAVAWHRAHTRTHALKRVASTRSQNLAPSPLGRRREGEP